MTWNYLQSGWQKAPKDVDGCCTGNRGPEVANTGNGGRLLLSMPIKNPCAFKDRNGKYRANSDYYVYSCR